MAVLFEVVFREFFFVFGFWRYFFLGKVLMVWWGIFVEVLVGEKRVGGGVERR